MPENKENQGDQVSWWFKLLARGVGVIGGIVAMITGLIRCLTFTPSCLVAGIWQICIGFLAVLFEAPCCCPFLDFVDKIGKFSETRPHWQKGVAYTLLSLLPVILCFNLLTLFGSGVVFATGVLYGMMALGKKGSREEMLLKATSDDIELKAGLMGKEETVDLQVPESSPVK